MIFLWYFDVYCCHSSERVTFFCFVLFIYFFSCFLNPDIKKHTFHKQLRTSYSFKLFKCSVYAAKTQRWNKSMFYFFIIFCAFSMCWIWWYEAILPDLVIYSCSVISCFFLYFFMKVPFNVSCSTLRKYSIPHSLLLYSVHVKWILICVQNVDKDEKYTWLYTLYTPALCGVFKEVHKENSRCEFRV